MNSRNHFRFTVCAGFFVALVSIFFVITSGCSRGNQGTALMNSVTQTNIRRLAYLYGTFQSQNLFKGPKDEQEFKEYISNMPDNRLKNFNVDRNKIDQLFISERDGEPFKIRWGLQFQSRQGPTPIVFEQKGVNGKLQVGFNGFEVREIDQSEHEDYWTGKRDEQQVDSNRGAPEE